MEISILLLSFIEVVSKFWIFILGSIAAGIILYAMHLGRRGETAKAVPTYSPTFVLGAFGFDLVKKSPFLSWIISIAFIILCVVMVYVLILNMS